MKNENNRGRVLSAEEITRYKSHAPEWLWPLVTLALRAGLRTVGMLNLRWQDVDLEDALITVKGKDTKTSMARTVPLNEDANEVMRALSQRPRGDDELVFARNGKPISTASISRVHRKTCQEAGVENFPFGDFRRTFVNNFVQAGVPLGVIAEVVGHKTPAMLERFREGIGND